MSQQNEIQLTEKEKAIRHFILNASLYKIILRLGLPIAFFQTLNQLFRVGDTFIASSIDAASVSMLTYFGQINLIIVGIGSGLATGAALKISEMYGWGDFEKVKTQISSIFAFSVLACLFLTAIIIPFSNPILVILNAPSEFIEMGTTYFIIEFIATMLMFINGVYLALEQVQGNAKRILYVNVASMVLRLVLTAIFVYVFHRGINMMAVATLISQGLIFVCGVYNLSGKSEVFTLSFKKFSINKELLSPMIITSIPIMIERAAFNLGKTIMNGMIAVMGPLVIGGLGITSMLGGVLVLPAIGFQDASITVMAQNFGAKQPERLLSCFKALFTINMIQAVIFFLPTMIFSYYITGVFAPDDPYFHSIVHEIHRFDVWGVLFLAPLSAVTALLLGLGHTKWVMMLNVFRLFVFRIPVLWFLQNFTDMGRTSAGFVMIFSNVATGISSMIIGGIIIYKLCKKENLRFFQMG